MGVIKAMRKIVFFLLLASALWSCKTQYVPVPERHTEWKWNTDTLIITDSVWTRDSVTVETVGDTVYKTAWKWRNVYKDRYKVRIDSFVRVDSVRVPYPVERQLTRWERVCLLAGKAGLWALAVAAAALLAWLAWLAFTRRR